MLTTDFYDIGHFFKNDKGVISFISLAEEQLLRKGVDFISANGFEQFEGEIEGLFIEEGASMIELFNVVRGLQDCKIPVFVGNYEFPKLLKFSFKKAEVKKDSYFPATQVCKAIALAQEDYKPIKTEQRLVLVDYATKMPVSKDEVVIFPTVVKNFKTVYPKTFDAWVRLLLKAKEFKTVNKEFLLFKSLFDVK